MSYFSKFKVGSTSYDVKDAAAGKSLSVYGNSLQLKNSAGNVISSVTAPGGSTIYYTSDIFYDTDHYAFYGPVDNFSPKANDIIIFERAQGVPKFIDFGNYRGITIKDALNGDNEFTLYTLGNTNSNKIRYLSTACNLIVLVGAVTTELTVIDIQPVYKNSNFLVRSNMLSNLANSADLTNVETNGFAYLYSYSNESDLTIYDNNNNDITSNCTVWVARGITTKNTYQTEIYIKTTTNTRIKSVVLNTSKYGIPTNYRGSSNYMTSITGCTGFFAGESVANLGEDMAKFTIANYSYLASTSTGQYHSIICI